MPPLFIPFSFSTTYMHSIWSFINLHSHAQPTISICTRKRESWESWSEEKKNVPTVNKVRQAKVPPLWYYKTRIHNLSICVRCIRYASSMLHPALAVAALSCLCWIHAPLLFLISATSTNYTFPSPKKHTKPF